MRAFRLRRLAESGGLAWVLFETAHDYYDDYYHYYCYCYNYYEHLDEYNYS